MDVPQSQNTEKNKVRRSSKRQQDKELGKIWGFLFPQALSCELCMFKYITIEEGQHNRIYSFQQLAQATETWVQGVSDPEMRFNKYRESNKQCLSEAICICRLMDT